MSSIVLLTAAKQDSEVFRSQLTEHEISLLHYPLEKYKAVEDDETVRNTFEHLEEFENIAHGSKRNAQFFVEKVSQLDKWDQARERLNLALNQHTADFLEEAGIPAVHPHSEGEAIDLMEFMLRVQRIGKTLYPCGDKTTEDLPGFLQELDIPVQELVLFTLEGPGKDKLQHYQEDIASYEPDIIIFHSRRSVNRMLAAFPDLNYREEQIISGDQAVSEKLATEDIEPDIQAEGSWESILEKIGGQL